MYEYMYITCSSMPLQVGIYTDSFRFILPNISGTQTSGSTLSGTAPMIDAPLAVSLVCRSALGTHMPGTARFEPFSVQY